MPSIACGMERGREGEKLQCLAALAVVRNNQSKQATCHRARPVRQAVAQAGTGFTCANQLGGGGGGGEPDKETRLTEPARPGQAAESVGVTMKRQTLFWSDIFKVAAAHLWEAAREEEISLLPSL